MMTRKRLFALVLAVCMVMQMVPFHVFAQETEPSDPTEPTETPVSPEPVMQAALDVAEAPGNTTVNGEPFDTTVSKNHRIPGLVTLSDGTLVASADARWNSEKDGGGLDVVVSFSKDQGKTWTYTYAAHLGDNGNVYNGGSSTIMDPLLITDGSDLYLVYDLFPAGYSLGTWNTNNAFGTSMVAFDAGGRLLLSNDSRGSYSYYLENGTIYTTSGTQVEGYTVDGWFNLYQNGVYVSNLFFSDCPFLTVPASFIAIQSYDSANGTWSDPELLNVKPEGPYWQVVGPGSGIVTSHGHLAFTAYDGDRVYLVWGTPGNWNWVRTENSQANNESSIVELSDGTIRAFVKNDVNTIRYLDFTWDETYSTYTVADSSATTCVGNTGSCMVSSLKLTRRINGREAILVCCPTRGSGQRYDGKIHVFLLDDDNNMDLLTTYQINSGFFAYSDMTELNGGDTIALLYEDGCESYNGGNQGPGYAHISYTTLDLNEIAPGAVITGGSYNTLSDQTTGIRVYAAGIKTLTVEKQIQSTPASGYDVSVTYSISLKDELGNTYDGSAVVKIPVPYELRNAESYYATVDGDEVEIPAPVDGVFTIEVPHFSDLTISADLKEVNIKIGVGESYVVTDETGNYEDDYVSPGAEAVLHIDGTDGVTTREEKAVTAALFEEGNVYLLWNNRAGGVLTTESLNYDNWGDDRPGLKVSSEQITDSNELWVIYPYADGWAIMRKGTGGAEDAWVTVAPGRLTMESVPQALTMSYQPGGYWLIYANCLDEGEYKDFYISDMDGNAWDGAISYTHDGTDEGDNWSIYKVTQTTSPGTSEITFTGAVAGTTTAVVGNVTYNITVTEYKEVDIVVYEGFSETVVVENVEYTDADVEHDSDPSSATVDVQGVVTGGNEYLSDVTSIESGKQYIVVNNRSGNVLLPTTYSGNSGHLSLSGKPSTDTTTLWTITSTGTDGYYTVCPSNGQYLSVTDGGAAVGTTQITLKLTHEGNGVWVIMNEEGTVYLNDHGGTGSHAAGYTGNDAGSKWTLKEIVSNPEERHSEITFTGVKADTTTYAIVGGVKYNITVLGAKEGTVEGFDNIVGTGYYEDNAPTKSTINLTGKTVNALDTTAGTKYQLDVNLSDYDKVYWTSADPGIATVDGNGNVTGVSAGETEVTATVIKDDIKQSITIPVRVLPSMMGSSTDAELILYYVSNVINTTPSYSMYVSGQGSDPVVTELTKVGEGHLVFMERPSDSSFGCIWTAAPDDGYALSYMASTGSAGNYSPLKTPGGALGEGLVDEVQYYKNGPGYNGVVNAGNDKSETWSDDVNDMLAEAINDTNKCDGAMSNSRKASDANKPIVTDLTFIADRRITVNKTVNGVLPTTRLRSQFRPYQDGMVATVGEYIYYTISVTVYKPQAWQDAENHIAAMTYEDVVLVDAIQNNTGSGKAYFYIQELDGTLAIDNFSKDGILSKAEIEYAIANNMIDANLFSSDLTTAYITDDVTEQMNSEWGADEEYRVLEYYVVYAIQESDIKNDTVTNGVDLTYTDSSRFSSGSHSSAVADNAIITTVGHPLPDYVMDFAVPFTVTDLNKDYGINEATEWTAQYGQIQIAEQVDANGIALQDTEGNQLYTMTYTPTSVLLEPDVITLTDPNTGKIVNGFLVYPASTVHYEEGFAYQNFTGVTGKTQDVRIISEAGENYGYNGSYLGNHQASNDTQVNLNGNKASFTFVGTGVDIYANCTADTGVAMVMIYQVINGSTRKLVKMYQIRTNTAAGTSDLTEMQTGSFYGLPICSVMDLPYGTYEVNISRVGPAGSGTDVFLDGFRVYNSLYNSAYLESYYAPGELSVIESSEDATARNPVFVELRDYILTAYSVSGITDQSQYHEAADAIMNMIYDSGRSGQGAFLLNKSDTLTQEQLKDLLDNGPKNEVYLAKGMSVTFSLKDGIGAQLGIKTVNGAAGSITINGTPVTVDSSVDMFYDIENGAQSNTVVIENTGENVISLTKLKLVRLDAEASVAFDQIFGEITQAKVSYSLLRMVSIPRFNMPVITRQPVDTSAVLNEDMAISLSAEGEDLRYQWYWRNAGAAEFKASSCKTDTYYTTMTEARDGRQIYCVITDANGNEVISDTVTLTRNADRELKILRQPWNGYAALNEEMEVSVIAQGEELHYQWYWRNAGAAEFQRSSCKTDTYYTTMNAARDGREIYCVITDVAGNSVTTNVVTLYRVAAVELEIVTQPADTGAVLNEAVEVTVEAVGEGLCYQWYWREAGQQEFKKSSCKTATYYTTMNAARDGREVYCVITDAVGNTVTTEVATLYRVAAVELEIVTQPADTGAVLNEAVEVTVEAVGEGLCYQWYWREAGQQEFKKSSCKTATYYTTMTKARNGREVYCVITDAVGNTVTTEVATLYRVAAVELEIVTQPADTGAVLNEAMAITVEAVGEGLCYQWYWRDAGQQEFSKSSCKTATYYTTMTKVRNGREIYCVITDAVGNTVTTEVATLYRVAAVELEIVTQPTDTVAARDEDMAITVEAVGEGLRYQWYWRNAGEQEFSKSSCSTDTYYTTMNDTRNGREIYCVITDAVGNQVMTDTVVLTMAE